MLWTIVVVLVALWLLGLVGGVGGSLIHVLLVLAVIVIAVNLLSGSRPSAWSSSTWRATRTRAATSSTRTAGPPSDPVWALDAHACARTGNVATLFGWDEDVLGFDEVREQVRKAAAFREGAGRPEETHVA